MDRAGLVSYGGERRRDGGLLRRLLGSVVALIGLVAKLGSLAKFAGLFVAFGGYALLWGWRFGLGFVVLIFLHEMGHFVEATRERLRPSWPVFLPFLGAYVRYTRGHPWQTARVAIAGPIAGGLASLACYGLARHQSSSLLEALAYTGFFLNLVNLIPVGIFDGGALWRSARWLWAGGGREKAVVAWGLYGATVVFCAWGAWLAYLPQHRL